MPSRMVSADETTRIDYLGRSKATDGSLKAVNLRPSNFRRDRGRELTVSF